MMRKFNLNFIGYYSDEKRVELPKKSGVYMVFVGQPLPDNKVDLKELIYIGKAEDLNQRLVTHDKHEKFCEKCKEGEFPYYSYTLVKTEDLDIVENALVYNTKLELNDRLKFNYNHTDSVRLLMGGQCSKLFGCTICVDVKSNGKVDTYTEEDVEE